jgi:hypothetical protein
MNALSRPPTHPDATRFSVWHPSGLHIDSDGPVQQSTIDALLILAKGLTTPRVDQGG